MYLNGDLIIINQRFGVLGYFRQRSANFVIFSNNILKENFKWINVANLLLFYLQCFLLSIYIAKGDCTCQTNPTPLLQPGTIKITASRTKPADIQSGKQRLFRSSPFAGEQMKI